MSGDHTRFSFDPHNGFSGVWQQQGRVSLEADFNEFEEVLDRLRRVGTYDTVGAGVVPVSTRHGFEIRVKPDAFTIGVGRAYVDGIQVECFGTGSVSYDGHVGNENGDTGLFLQYPSIDEWHKPDPPSPADHQPFGYPKMNLFDKVAPYLVYLDVWQREVTVYEHPDLREPALGGPDTTTRVQSAWQAKVLQMDPKVAPDCSAPIDGWDGIVEPSTGRLTVTVDPAAVKPLPCEVPAKAGYVGLENRLYRVEIHRGGQLGNPDHPPPQFKWSRDNASLVATVTKISRVGTGSKITVTSTGRDAFLRFEKGQYIELLDDWVEFGLRDNGKGGDLAKITQNVDHETGEITIDKDLSGFELKNERHPRIRRWDIAKDGDDALRAAVVGTKFALEDGIFIEFGPKGSRLRAGDYWVFAARTATGDILPEVVKDEPPKGVLHHFMKLAVVQPERRPPEVISDCRVMWPSSGKGCGCDFCVTAESHNSGAYTIQQAIDDAIAANGGTVCLGIGTYQLTAGLTVKDAASVHIRGSGFNTLLLSEAEGAALSISDAVDTRISDLSIFTLAPREDGDCAIDLSNTAQVTLEGLYVFENVSNLAEAPLGGPAAARGTAVQLRGDSQDRIEINDCLLVGDILAPRQGAIAGQRVPRFIKDLSIRNNIIDASIDLTSEFQPNIFYGHLVIEGNSVSQPEKQGFGIGVAGFHDSGGIIRGNRILTKGSGVVVAMNRCIVDSNTITGQGDRFEPAPGVGINVLGAPFNGADHIRIALNSIQRLTAGIAMATTLGATDVAITDNRIAECVGGVVAQEGSGAETIRVAGNTITTTEGDVLRGLDYRAGIAIFGADRVEISHNSVERPESRTDERDFAIAVIGCALAKISDNVIDDLGASRMDGDPVGTIAGIYSSSAFDQLDISSNIARPLVPDDGTAALWNALYVDNSRPDERTPWRSRLVATEDTLYWRSDQRLIRLTRRVYRRAVSIRGNTLDGAGDRTPMVKVMSDVPAAATEPPLHCSFLDNICQSAARRPDPAVALGSREFLLAGLVLSTNQILYYDKSKGLAVAAYTVRDPSEQNYPVATVLGNITSERIEINDADLDVRWKHLNVRLNT